MKKKRTRLCLSAITIRRLGYSELCDAVGGGFPTTKATCKFTCEPDCLDPTK